jgi:hypothetical protein
MSVHKILCKYQKKCDELYKSISMAKSKLTETKKGKTGERQSQRHAHNFLFHQGDTEYSS